MNEFESSTEEVDIAATFNAALEVNNKPVEPIPFVLRDGTEASSDTDIPRKKYKLRRKEHYSRKVKVIGRIKRGPGKGRIRCIEKQYWREYWAYYGIQS